MKGVFLYFFRKFCLNFSKKNYSKRKRPFFFIVIFNMNYV